MTSDIIKIRALLKYMTQHRAHWYTFCHPLIEIPRAAILRSSQGRIFKGSSDQSHFIFETNFGKRMIRQRTVLKLNDEFYQDQ